jgi:2TM domain
MNTPALSPDQIERIALRRVKAKMGWYLHASIYLIVNICLAAVALSQGRHWNLFPFAGWGLGLAIHGAAVWLQASARGFAWREQMIAKERAVLKNQQLL